MLKSMTGFGRSKVECDGREYIVEIKSVNHKYTDISVKMPRTIGFLEENTKKLILSFVSRGKIDVFITFNNHSNIGKKIIINKEIAKMYIKQLSELAEETGIMDDVSAMSIMQLPEVLSVQATEDEELLWKELDASVKVAIDNFNNSRQIEGEKLLEDMNIRISKILEDIEGVSKYSTGLIGDYVVKLEERIKEILKTDIIDENRLAQEVVIYSDKCSVEEEITRLKSHVLRFKELIHQQEYAPIGKTLDFIVQEMNRETNTIGSKANCLDITKLVIDMKTEIENIREQIQNVE